MKTFKEGEIIVVANNTKVYKIDTVTSCGLHATSQDGQNAVIVLFDVTPLRHATEEEIEAGVLIDEIT